MREDERSHMMLIRKAVSRNRSVGSAALLIATQQIIDETRVDQRFTAGEIRRMHQLWLAESYEWAGEYRL
jgi:hypothetical protein